jgi:hypothetical protein
VALRLVGFTDTTRELNINVTENELSRFIFHKTE